MKQKLLSTFVLITATVSTSAGCADESKDTILLSFSSTGPKGQMTGQLEVACNGKIEREPGGPEVPSIVPQILGVSLDCNRNTVHMKRSVCLETDTNLHCQDKKRSADSLPLQSFVADHNASSYLVQVEVKIDGCSDIGEELLAADAPTLIDAIATGASPQSPLDAQQPDCFDPSVQTPETQPTEIWVE